MLDFGVLRQKVHVWTASFSQVGTMEGEEALSASVLDASERLTAQRIVHLAARDRYVRSRTLLRTVLSAYVSQEADRIRFAYRDQGKPYVPDQPLCFNVSHSHDCWMVALTAAGEIGADIERLAPLGGMEAVIRRYMPKEEREQLSDLDPQRKMVAFYRLWTQLEAFVKLHGLGLHAKVQTIRRTAEGGLLFADRPDSLAACESYAMRPGYIASIAVTGPLLPVVMLEWPPDERKFDKGVKPPCIMQTTVFP